jgi:hypothetical protein
MNFNDYFTGLSNVAEAIQQDTQLVFDGIDRASGGVWNEEIKYAEADLMTIIRQAWCLKDTIEHFIEYNSGRFEALEKIYKPPYIAK